MAEVFTCVRKIWDGPLNFRCDRPAKFYVNSGAGPTPLCGIHARSERAYGRVMKPIAELSPSASVGTNNG